MTLLQCNSCTSNAQNVHFKCSKCFKAKHPIPGHNWKQGSAAIIAHAVGVEPTDVGGQVFVVPTVCQRHELNSEYWYGLI